MPTATNEPELRSAVRRRAPQLLVFFASAAVLVVEIAAGRLVAPFVGVSLETYTGIIGTVLAGIALGSWAGGWSADRVDPRHWIGPVLVAAGAASLAAVPIISAVGPVVASTGGGPVGIVTLALLAFVAPTALLSAVPPMVAKLQLHSIEHTGEVVGGLSAAGTAGALVGTFATGFVLLPTLPTRTIVVGVGVAVIVVGLALTIASRRRITPAVPLTLIVLVGLSVVIPSPCDLETSYYCVAIERDPARPSGRILVLDDLRHSYVDLDDPTHLEFRYASLFAQVIDAAVGSPTIEALHVGGGGFSLPRWLEATRPGSRSTVLELDDEIVDLAEDELGLELGPRLEVEVGDARLRVAEQPAGRYDLVVADAFGGRSVPWHLTTQEFLAEVVRTMRAEGIYLLNMIDGDELRLVRAEIATLAESFRHVAVIRPPEGHSGNHVVIASARPLDLPEVDPAEGRLLTGAAVERFARGAAVLRDDFAPADQLLSAS